MSKKSNEKVETSFFSLKIKFVWRLRVVIAGIEEIGHIVRRYNVNKMVFP